MVEIQMLVDFQGKKKDNVYEVSKRWANFAIAQNMAVVAVKTSKPKAKKEKVTDGS